MKNKLILAIFTVATTCIFVFTTFFVLIPISCFTDLSEFEVNFYYIVSDFYVNKMVHIWALVFALGVILYLRNKKTKDVSTEKGEYRYRLIYVFISLVIAITLLFITKTNLKKQPHCDFFPTPPLPEEAVKHFEDIR